MAHALAQLLAMFLGMAAVYFLSGLFSRPGVSRQTRATNGESSEDLRDAITRLELARQRIEVEHTAFLKTLPLVGIGPTPAAAARATAYARLVWLAEDVSDEDVSDDREQRPRP